MNASRADWLAPSKAARVSARAAVKADHDWAPAWLSFWSFSSAAVASAFIVSRPRRFLPTLSCEFFGSVSKLVHRFVPGGGPVMVGFDGCSGGNARCLRWRQPIGSGGVQAGLRLISLGRFFVTYYRSSLSKLDGDGR